MSSSTIASLELAELKQERDNFKEDLQTVRFELANTRSEFQVKFCCQNCAVGYLCACVLPGSFRGMGTFYFERDVLNTTLLTRITAHEQIINNEGLNKNITFNYYETMYMSRQQPE